MPVKGGSGGGGFEVRVSRVSGRAWILSTKKVGGKDRWEFIFAVCGGERKVCGRDQEVIHGRVESFRRGGVEDIVLKVFGLAVVTT